MIKVSLHVTISVCLSAFILLTAISANSYAESRIPLKYLDTNQIDLQRTAQYEPVSQDNTYVNVTDGLTVTVPKDWSEEDGQNMPNDTILTVAHISPPISLDPRASMSVGIYKDTTPKANSIDGYLRDSINLYRSNVKDFGLVSAGLSQNMSGHKAYQLLYTYTPSDPTLGPSKNLEIGFLLNGQAFYIDYYGSANLFPTFLPQVRAIVNSLIVHPPS